MMTENELAKLSDDELRKLIEEGITFYIGDRRLDQPADLSPQPTKKATKRKDA